MSSSNSSSQIQKMHGALMSANLFFGIGAVVGALGLPATHPLAFALVREFWAGLILLGISYYLYEYSISSDNTQQRSEDNQEDETDNSKTHEEHTKVHVVDPLWGWKKQWKSFAVLGLVVLGNQGGFIVGIKLAGPVTASVWQPSQPIFTAAICMALGWEPPQPKRLAGVLIAAGGCIMMVLLKKNNQQHDETTTDFSEEDDIITSASSSSNYLIGNFLFFCNCLCTSLYVILSKKMLTIYPSLCVTAWSYNFAVVYMALGCWIAANTPGSQQFFCPECADDWEQAEKGFLHLPSGAIPALLYYIFFASVGSYGLITWANQHATGTLVMSYTVLQPVTSAILTTTLLIMGIVSNCSQQQQQKLQPEDDDITNINYHPHQNNNMAAAAACLDYPSFGTFCGMIGVFTGLTLIISTEPTTTTTTTRPNKQSIINATSTSSSRGEDDNDETELESIPFLTTTTSNNNKVLEMEQTID